MEARSSQTRVFGGNPGNFRQPKPFTLARVMSEVARSVRRRAAREAFHAGMAGLANLSNQRFHRSKPRFCCSCCGQTAYAFLHLSNRLRIAWNSACPICDSRSRHRGLALLIPKLLRRTNERKRVLHFAPEAVLKKVILDLPNIEYRTTDLFVKDVDYPGENIEALSFGQDAFGVVICNHVLEHVADDNAAIGELARILTTDGVAVVTIPGDWRRQDTITFPNTDLNGHYRDYGLDVKDLLHRSFSTVEVFDLHDLDAAPDGLSFGIRPNDVAFICRDPRHGETGDQAGLGAPANHGTKSLSN